MTILVEEGLVLTSSRSTEQAFSVTCVGRICDRYEDLLPAERSLLTASSARRRDEFSSARVLARRAMHACLLSPGPVLRAHDRSPVWPAGMRGSLTHSRDLAAASISTRLAGVGIDLEQAGRLSEKAARRVLLPEEAEQLQRLPGGVLTWSTLVFSAKEAVYKAVYPIAGLYIGYREVLVSLDTDACTFTARYVGVAGCNKALDVGRGSWWHLGDTRNVVLTRFEIGGEG